MKRLALVFVRDRLRDTIYLFYKKYEYDRFQSLLDRLTKRDLALGGILEMQNKVDSSFVAAAMEALD